MKSKGLRAFRLLSVPVIAFLLALSLIARVLLTLHRQLNADEFQHLHASWMVHLGYLPYRDFWENHAPLLYFLCAPILSFFGEGVTSVIVVRVLLSAAGLAIAGLVYGIARLDYDRHTAILAVLILSFSEIFLQKTIEVRTDQFLVLCWLLSLWFIYRVRDHEMDGHLLIAGFALGIGMLFSPKAIICYAAAAITILAQAMLPSLRILKRQTLFAAGFLVPVTALGLYFNSHGIFKVWIDSTILQNLSYPDTRGPFFLLLPQNLGFLLLGFAGMILSLRDQNFRKEARHKTPALMMIASWVPLLILIFFMPSTFSQSALTFVPFFAIYGAFALKRSLEWTGEFRLKHILFSTFTLLAALIVPIASLLTRASYTESNHKQMDLIRYILKQTRRDEVIFDGNAAYIFRKQAYYYGSLVEGIRFKIERAEISESIIESLKRHPCRVVLYDDRISDLPPQIQDFIRRNYLPVGQNDVFIAGKELGAENLSGNKAISWIELPLVYSIHAKGNLIVDGEPYIKPVLFKRGKHQILSDQELLRVTIRAD